MAGMTRPDGDDDPDKAAAQVDDARVAGVETALTARHKTREGPGQAASAAWARHSHGPR
jgi:hypothetical protein